MLRDQRNQKFNILMVETLRYMLYTLALNHQLKLLVELVP